MRIYKINDDSSKKYKLFIDYHRVPYRINGQQLRGNNG